MGSTVLGPGALHALSMHHRYDDNTSMSLEDNEAENTKINGRVMLTKKKESQGSRKVETPSNKRWSDSF